MPREGAFVEEEGERERERERERCSECVREREAQNKEQV
jgi:hypothetical protein